MDVTQIPITLTMPVGAVNVILNALGKLPHDEVNELVVGIRRISLQQIQEHQQKAQAEAAQPPAQADSEGGDPA
jgi:hypothetical protein